MRKSNFALRLQPSLLDEARKLAEEEGVARALSEMTNVYQPAPDGRKTIRELRKR